MNTFLDRISVIADTFPDRPALASEKIQAAVSYGELWTQSGKIYSALKTRGIGREDLVLIHLPHGPEIPIAMLGIWRAGAACIITEESCPEERFRAILTDSGAALEMNEAVYRDMTETDPREGYEEISPQDACYAVYTSGTTGKPKGILHEFGKIDLCIQCMIAEGQTYTREGNRIAIFCSQEFVAFFILSVPKLFSGYTLFIPSTELSRRPEKLKIFLQRESITEAFMAPALLRVTGKLPDGLKAVFTGGESPAGLAADGTELYNLYGMSESAFTVSIQKLDRVYDPVPAGQNRAGMEILIGGMEKGDQILSAPGKKGEVMIRNPYTRGYIHLPEKTEEVFRDGILRTGDLGYLDEGGTLFLCGRMDDMIKIHGNRAEPGEIEVVARKVMRIEHAAVKGFRENGRAYFALYLLKKDFPEGLPDPDGIREKMGKYLPYYMIPAHFILLEHFPTNENGKLKRRDLPAPAGKNREEYLAPRTENERRICCAMEKVLECGRIGIRDDFFEQGGDSISAIRLAEACGELSITSGDIFRARTAERLAALCPEGANRERNSKEQAALREAKERLREAGRKALEIYEKEGRIDSFYASLLTAPNYMLTEIRSNPGMIFRMDEEIDEERLQQAVNLAALRCPYVLYDIRLHEGMPWVSFHTNPLPLPVLPAGRLTSYGTAENNRHYAMVAYETDRIHFGMSHVLTDGQGFFRFIDRVLKAYTGNDNGKPQEDGTLAEGALTDFASVDLPLPEGYILYENPDTDPFSFSPDPEGKGHFSGKIRVPAEQLHRFAARNSMTLQEAVCVLLGQAIQETCPENRKIIRIRCPIDTRSIFGIPETFQNASIPHLFLNIDPRKLDTDALPKLAEDLNEQFSNQFCYSYSACMTNRFSRFFRTGDLQDIQDTLNWYVSQTGIFASYMGRVADGQAACHVIDMDQPDDATFPLMLYVKEIGSQAYFQVLQQFEDDRFFRGLGHVLKRL